MSESSPIVYGNPPADLATIPADAVQVSPLILEAANLEDFASDSISSATLLAPPGTIERRYALALSIRALKSGGELLALAPKDKGGSRLAKELKAFGLEPEEDSRRHHRICRAVKTSPNEAALSEAILAGAPRFDEKLQAFTQPGCFSWDRLDAGSALLLEKIPPLKGRGADLGAGLGILTRAVLARSPQVSHMHLLELDRRSVAMAAKNVDAARTTIHRADVRALPMKLGHLDFIVMNPPFHDGGQEDHSLGEAFLETAAGLLSPGGTAWIVANRHLAYEAVIKKLFKDTQLLVETGGFKVYKAER